MLQTYRRQPVAFVRGEGPRLYDVDGREYLDLVSGIGVDVARPRAPGARRRDRRSGGDAAAHLEPLLPPAPGRGRRRGSTKLSGLARVFFCNSGTEAVEACLKFARRYWHTQGVTTRTGFVALEDAFAGRTMGALSVTWDEHYRAPFSRSSDRSRSSTPAIAASRWRPR